MRDSISPKLAKWPFFLANALLLALAWFIYHQSKLPMGHWEILGCIFCVVAGALFGLWPFVLEYQSAARLVETGALTGVVSQIQNLKQLANQISNATAQWTTVQESAEKTARQAQEIAQGMAAEVKTFNEFLEHSNDSEKATLRLEVDKLHRAETEWLQVLVRMLDHIYALNRAAIQSRQPKVIEQLSHFQNACRDAARRVGLAPFVAAPEEKFDGQRHQLVDGESQSTNGAAVDETVATGYTFQGKLLRPALVRLRNGDGAKPELAKSETDVDAEPAQDQLPLVS